MSAVCVLGTGALPAANVLTADAFVDIVFKPETRYVKPGETVNIDIKLNNIGFNAVTLGGFQLSVPTPSGLTSNGITTYFGKPVAVNPETGEVAVVIENGGTALDRGQSMVAVTYTFTVPENAKNGDSYSFIPDARFPYACDPDGNELLLELQDASTIITVNDGSVPVKKQMSFKLEIEPKNVSLVPGDEFEIAVVAGGDDIGEMTGFQIKLDMPEGIECLGMNGVSTWNGGELVFNKDTAELASAQPKGNTLGIAKGDTIAKITFKVAADYALGTYTFSAVNAWVADSAGNEMTPVIDRTNKLVVTGDVPITAGKLGDANLDGVVDAKDASKVLVEYALLSTGKPETFNDQQKANGDVNFDTKIDSKDASKILAYYAYLSTGGEDIMEVWVQTH
jgi:hypothetical protein